MKNEHRIEVICKTPQGELETITITVSAKASPGNLAAFAKQLRDFLEIGFAPEEPLTVQAIRDYQVS